MMHRTIGGLAVCAVVAAAGCAGERASDAGQWTNPPRHEPPKPESAKKAPGGANRGEAAPTAQPADAATQTDALAAQVEQDMADLQAALEERDAARASGQVAATPAPPPASPSEPQAGPSTPSTGNGAAVMVGEGGVASANVEEAIETGESAADTTEETAATVSERVEVAAAQLATLLEQWADAEGGGRRALLALGALEVLHEGTLREDALSQLGEEDADGMRAWAAMHRDAARRAESGETDPGVGAARALVPAISPDMLRVDTALLCSKVEGFGRYQTLDGSALLAGRGQRAIVYAEVSGFSHRAMANDRGEPGWMVELTQELSLYHDADQVLAWRRPEQVISDFSRNKRRDFFVVQMVELPATLSIGAYNLKVTMRDREGGAVAEAIIPLRVVADPALTRGSR